jgi:hypothetical protein
MGNVAGCGQSSLNRVTLALEADSRFIQWTPTREVDFVVVIQAADGNGKTATQAFTIKVGLDARQTPRIQSCFGSRILFYPPNMEDLTEMRSSLHRLPVLPTVLAYHQAETCPYG